jgi:hypothetical protein
MSGLDTLPDKTDKHWFLANMQNNQRRRQELTIYCADIQLMKILFNKCKKIFFIKELRKGCKALENRYLYQNSI